MKRTRFVLILLPLLLAGCLTRRVLDARQQVCDNLVTLDRAIAAVRSANEATISAVTSIDQARDRAGEALQQIKASFNEVSEAEMNPQAETQIDQLERAYEDLSKTVEALPDQYTEVQLKAIVAEKVATVESASIRVQAGLRCR